MKRLGILGTFVWDTVWTLADQAAGRALETWGGVGYSLGSAAATLPDGWEIVPIAHVGSDLIDRAHGFLDALPGIGSRAGIVPVDQPNNRVELVYTSAADRGETMSGGVPGWTGPELAPHLESLDALYVDFLSGWEMDLETARGLGAFRRSGRPVYADLHSLFLGPPRVDGPREPRRLPRSVEWLRCFDAVQVNDQEFALFDEPPASPPIPPSATEAERAHAHTFGPLRAVLDVGPSAVFMTRGERGALFVGDRAFPNRGEEARDLVCGDAPAAALAGGGDPTGCGDVWGASVFCGLVGGMGIAAAVRRANALAATKMRHRGATGLYEHLTACRAEWQ